MAHIRRSFPIVLVLLAVGVAVLLLVTEPKARSTAAVLDQTRILAAAADLGLSPDSIVASGLASSMQAVLERLVSAAAECESLAQLRENLRQARHAQTQAETALSLNPADQQLHAALEAAIAQAATAQQGLTALRSQLLDTVLAGVSPEIRARLEAYRANSDRAVPPELRITQRTANQWRDIETALIAERRALRLGKPLNSTMATLLANVRAEPAVVQAQSLLQSSLGPASATFNQVMGLPTSG